MPFLVRKPKWHNIVRDSAGVQEIRAGFINEPTLQVLTEASDRLLRWKKFERRTEECDIYLNQKIRSFREAFFVREVGILACIHLLSHDQARGQIWHARPEAMGDGNGLDPGFDALLPAYLGCIIAAQKARGDVFTEHEAKAAKELLAVVQGTENRDFPSLWKLLWHVSQDNAPWPNLISDELLLIVLKRTYFRNNLLETLEDFRQQRRWKDAYKLIYGLPEVYPLPRAREILEQVFPEYPMWATWCPDKRRIYLWAERTADLERRERLFPLFDLEGPDFTQQQRGTLRRSSPGHFTAMAPPRPPQAQYVLDDILNCLDSALLIGPESISLLADLCLGSRTIEPRNLQMLQAALNFYDDSKSRIFRDYLAAMNAQNRASPYDAAVAVAAALPLIKESEVMRGCYGDAFEIRRKGPDILTAVQRQLCESLYGRHLSSEPLAHVVGALGKALLDATWLHEWWRSDFIDMLRIMPDASDINRLFKDMERLRSHQNYIDYLAESLGGMQKRSGIPTPAPFPSVSTLPRQPQPSTQAPYHPIWVVDMEFNRYSLRSRLLAIPKIPPELATRCIEQSQEEADVFVKALATKLASVTDQTPGNLADILANRIKNGVAVHACWKDLLLYVLQSLNVSATGLFERKSRELRRYSGNSNGYLTWTRWIANLETVLGNRLYDSYGEGGPGGSGGGGEGGKGESPSRTGFTKEKVEGWRRRLAPVSRNSSTSTTSTGETGRWTSGLSETPLTEMSEEWQPATVSR